MEEAVPVLIHRCNVEGGVVLGSEESGKAGLLAVVGAVPDIPVVPPGGAVRGGQRGLSAIHHRSIPHGREGIQLVPSTLGAVTSIVQPRMIATMPLPPQV